PSQRWRIGPLPLSALARRGVGSIAAALILSHSAHADAPLNYLRTHGFNADTVTTLVWGTMIISAAVVIVTTVLLFAALFRPRAGETEGEARILGGGGGLSWISIGVGVSAVVLFVVTVWTVVTLAQVSRMPVGQHGLRLNIIGHQWWWEVRYQDSEPSQN